jgi:8-oxo-dGTP pyrophosphatase MutT (NUDIX family)
LPGGKTEEGDADDAATALRESKEEIGLDPNLITVVASLEHFLSKVHAFCSHLNPYIKFSQIGYTAHCVMMHQRKSSKLSSFCFSDFVTKHACAAKSILLRICL